VLSDEIPGLGCLPDPPDERDFIAALYLPPPVAIPDFDYRPELGPLRNQGNTPRCVGYGHASQELWYERKHSISEILSGNYIYEGAKSIDGMPKEEGTYPRAAYAWQKDHGACEEKFYNTTKEGNSAWEHRIQGYASCGNDIGMALQAAYQNGPVGTSIMVYDNITAAKSTGVVPMPTPRSKAIGGHRLVLAAYERDERGYGFFNSWGEWGDGGTLWMAQDVADFCHIESHTIIDLPTDLPWKDWPEGKNVAEGCLVKDAGAMHGYPDETFRPWANVLQRHVGTVMGNLDLKPTQRADSWEEATRGWVHLAFPQLVFLETRWDEKLTRFQLALLVARYLFLNQ
jgi:hypothetical protein